MTARRALAASSLQACDAGVPASAWQACTAGALGEAGVHHVAPGLLAAARGAQPAHLPAVAVSLAVLLTVNDCV